VRQSHEVGIWDITPKCHPLPLLLSSTPIHVPRICLFSEVAFIHLEKFCKTAVSWPLTRVFTQGSEQINGRRMKPIPQDRELTPTEYMITRWLLEHERPEALQFIGQ